MALPPCAVISPTTLSAPGFAGGVVDDDRRAFGGEVFGNGRADAFGRAGDDGDFAGQFFVRAHVVFFLL